MAVFGELVFDLEERVRLVVELWGEGEALEAEKTVEVAGDLYGFSPSQEASRGFPSSRCFLMALAVVLMPDKVCRTW